MEGLKVASVSLVGAVACGAAAVGGASPACCFFGGGAVFCICPAHTGHRGLFRGIWTAHERVVSTCGCHSGGLNEKWAYIRSEILYKPVLWRLISRYLGSRTYILSIKPIFWL